MLELIPEEDLASDETVIGRYMSLSSFLDLISNKRLFFSRRSTFSDQLEAKVPIKTKERIQKWVRSGGKLGLCRNGEIDDATDEIERLYISSWAAGTESGNFNESIAMWNMYTPSDYDGVLVLSSVKQFKSAALFADNQIAICKIRYFDHIKDEIENVSDVKSCLEPIRLNTVS